MFQSLPASNEVFSSFCPRGVGGSHVTIVHDALDLTVQGLSSVGPPRHGTSASDIWWSSLDTCSNFFTSGSPSPCLTFGGYWSTYGRRKWAVCILLECLLVVCLDSLTSCNSPFGILGCCYIFLQQFFIFLLQVA